MPVIKHALVVACAVGPVLWFGTATAHADPDPNAPVVDPRAQCESPQVGGIFSTVAESEVPRSICFYLVEGYAYFDNYENNTYTGTTVYRDGAQVPTERPTIPGLFEIPPGLLPF